MDGREQLRRYLEQRRDAGEHELVLDHMAVDDVLRLVGVRGTSAASRAPEAPGSPRAPLPPRVEESEEAHPPAEDWRSVLTAATATRTDTSPIPSRDPVAPGSARPSGITIGQPHSDLFGGPLSALKVLDDVARAVASCTRCPLYATAISPVPGEGSATAPLVCVGEAPGAKEDETGRPFVGQAGKLLDKILAAIQLQREDVFICNVLKHRPPGNRNPMPDEVTACSPFLVRQLEIIRPKVIVAFGTFAAQTLLNTKDSIGKLRGAVHRYYGVPLIVTYHPAALLRNPAWKRPTWEDVQHARRILDGTGV